MPNLVRVSSVAAIHPALASGRARARLHGLTRRVAAGADFLLAARRMDIARMMISWADLRRDE